MNIALQEAAVPIRPAALAALKKIATGQGDWRAYAALALDEAACLNEDLTSDQVWEVLTAHGVPSPTEPRGMGAVMITGSKTGLIEPTPEFRVSKEPATKRHGGRPQRVFRSLVFGQKPEMWPDVAVLATSPRPATPIGRVESFSEWRCPRCGRPLGGVVVNGENGIGECVDHGRQRTRRRV